MSGSGKIGVVVIGRNEGERLARCLASVCTIARRVYVDSGSTDGSVALARDQGVTVIELEVPPRFTAARARNAGLAQLLVEDPDLEFVQMVDGDCEAHPLWVVSALEVLRTEPELAVVSGRLRERYPDRSIFNALCEDEWNPPAGLTAGVGGNALFRVAALREVEFFNPAMIAGEEMDLGMRLRARGWQLRRITAEMGLHDANITRLRQWWNRMRRSGHACGELAILHPEGRDPNWRAMVAKIFLWSVVVPGVLAVTILLALLVDSRWWIAALLASLAWPLNTVRLMRRERSRGLSPRLARASAFFLMLGKLPQLLGLIGYHRNRLSGRASSLIEYKTAGDSTAVRDRRN